MKQLAVHHCGHEGTHDSLVTPSECLYEQVHHDSNAQHFFIATQDRTLQRKVSSMPSGAVLFATVNGIQMEMPSEKQKTVAMRYSEDKQLHLGASEKRMLSEESGSRGDQAGGWRRKRAKGPNPLSMKKKTKLTIPGDTASGRPEGQDGDLKPKRKRQRRSRDRDE
jgi:U3 small nucleolar RNA-associated protein 23